MWVKLDDGFHGNPKVLRAWNAHHQSIGLHALALSYCGSHETNGKVPPEYVAMIVPKAAEREKSVAALVDAGLWETNGEGWHIHDFLKMNPSRASQEKKRSQARSRAKKYRSRKAGQ